MLQVDMPKRRPTFFPTHQVIGCLEVLLNASSYGGIVCFAAKSFAPKRNLFPLPLSTSTRHTDTPVLS